MIMIYPKVVGVDLFVYWLFYVGLTAIISLIEFFCHSALNVSNGLGVSSSEQVDATIKPLISETLLRYGEASAIIWRLNKYISPPPSLN